MPLSRRTFYLAGFLVCAAAIGTALFMQMIQGMEPCPLCIFQRIFVMLTGTVFLVAFIHNPESWGNRIYGLGGTLVALAGSSISIRHLYVQSLPPDQTPGCGPGIDYMLEVLPLFEVLEEIFKGSGECAEVLWRFLGLSIPGWTLVLFIFLALLGIYQAFRQEAL